MPTSSVAIIGSYAVALVMDAKHLPISGETVLASNFRQTWGGKGSDMAVQAARLGANSQFVGVVGEDSYGDDFVRLMRREGVGIDGLRRTSELSTGAGFIVKDFDGHNMIAVDMGANSLFRTIDIDANQAILADADVAVAQLEIPIETALYGLREAKRHGATTILNPAPGQDLSDVDLSGVDYVTPNGTELGVCIGLDADSEYDEATGCRKLLDQGCGCVIVTKGESGSAVVSPTQSFAVPAIDVDVQDTNGAGDSFNAALAVALGEGRALDEAVRFASVTAGLSCTAWETVQSYPDRRTVDEVLSRQANT